MTEKQKSFADSTIKNWKKFGIYLVFLSGLIILFLGKNLEFGGGLILVGFILTLYPKFIKIKKESIIIRQNWLLIVLSSFIIFLTLFIIFQNEEIKKILQGISMSVYQPKPYLSPTIACKVIQGSKASLIFSLNLTDELFYMDEITITAKSSIASQPYIRILIPKDVEQKAITSEPKISFSESEEKSSYYPQKTYKVLSATFSGLDLVPENSIKVFVLYSQTEKDNLKQISREINYGSAQTGQLSLSIICYSGFEIY